MPSPSKAKGNRFEREIVNEAKKAGFTAVRAWGSNGQSLGLHEEVDLTIGKNPLVKIQAKCRKKLASFLLPSEHVDAVVCKQDRGETLIIMRFDDWLDDKFVSSMPEER
jgi:Holliday junction resolvase|tara:strand:- start:155 stop:481 length:327 start_codon:yes stop_codon:yes gene_type:complete